MSDLVFYCQGPYNFIFWQKGPVVNRLFICKEILNNGVDKLDPFLTWDRSYLWINKVCLHTQCPWDDAIVSPQVEIVSFSGPTSPLHFFAHANNIIPITFSGVFTLIPLYYYYYWYPSQEARTQERVHTQRNTAHSSDYTILKTQCCLYKWTFLTGYISLCMHVICTLVIICSKLMIVVNIPFI